MAKTYAEWLEQRERAAREIEAFHEEASEQLRPVIAKWAKDHEGKGPFSGRPVFDVEVNGGDDWQQDQLKPLLQAKITPFDGTPFLLEMSTTGREFTITGVPGVGGEPFIEIRKKPEGIEIVQRVSANSHRTIPLVDVLLQYEEATLGFEISRKEVWQHH